MSVYQKFSQVSVLCHASVFLNLQQVSGDIDQVTSCYRKFSLVSILCHASVFLNLQVSVDILIINVGGSCHIMLTGNLVLCSCSVCVDSLSVCNNNSGILVNYMWEKYPDCWFSQVS